MPGFRDFFRKVFSGGSDSVAGIDIGSSAIKVVQIRRQGAKALLETYGELALGPYGNVPVGQTVRLSLPKIVEALRDILKEAKVTTKLCGVAIPLSSSLVSFIELPTSDPKKLATMVPLEARRFIPVPINEVTLDWMVVPKEAKQFAGPGTSAQTPGTPPAPHAPQAGAPTPAPAEGELFSATAAAGAPVRSFDRAEILIAAIHNQTLDHYRSVMSELNLSAQFYEIEIFSTIRAVLGNEVAPVMVFDMGAAATKIYLVEAGIVRDSHIVNRGSQEITAMIARTLGIDAGKAEEMKRGVAPDGTIGGKPISELIPTHIDYVFSEANRVLLHYEREHNRVVKKVVLCGGGVLLPGLTSIAQSHFGAEVIFANPFAKLEAPAFLSDMLAHAGPEFSVAIGAALRLVQENL